MLLLSLRNSTYLLNCATKTLTNPKHTRCSSTTRARSLPIIASLSTVLEAFDDPYEEYVGNFKWGSHVDAARTGHPTVYAFTYNEGPTIRTSGAPELMTKLRISFEPEPEWLDDATWYDWEARSSDELETLASEVKDDLCLRSTQW